MTLNSLKVKNVAKLIYFYNFIFRMIFGQTCYGTTVKIH